MNSEQKLANDIHKELLSCKLVVPSYGVINLYTHHLSNTVSFMSLLFHNSPLVSNSFCTLISLAQSTIFFLILFLLMQVIKKRSDKEKS